MKATQLLANQHRELDAMFGKLLKADDPRIRRAFTSEISSMLEIHMTIEESFFYPAYRQASGTRRGAEMVLEAFEEHHVMDLILAELPRADPSSERFEARIRVLRRILERHAQKEEQEFFPDAERKLGVENLYEIGARMGERASHLAT